MGVRPPMLKKGRETALQWVLDLSTLILLYIKIAVTSTKKEGFPSQSNLCQGDRQQNTPPTSCL